MKTCRISYLRWELLILLLGFHQKVHLGEAITLSGSESYARFPTWNGCPNASFSFEFRTTMSTAALLWYVDDGGRYDFFQVSLESGRVHLILKLVSEAESSTELTGNPNVTDGMWHHVEVRRRRMETVLTVDSFTTRNYSFGSDFEFGFDSNSDVFVGGLPRGCRDKLTSYALPSACFKSHFRGNIRNVIYNNCTCHLERVEMLDGQNAREGPEDRCETDCADGCICIRHDANSICRCDSIQCSAAIATHYELPMDEIRGRTLVNPSGLDAMAYGTPPLRTGIIEKAVELNGKSTFIKVSGPGHRSECFGDLDRCPDGYTLGFWINFMEPGSDSAYTFLSNGGHSPENFGIAMIYQRRIFEVHFKKKSGEEWIIKFSGVLPHRWCHVASSWHPDHGLFLYINGELVSSINTVRTGSPVVRSEFNDFIIGKSNDETAVVESYSILVDDFNFWSIYKSAKEIREIGPFYRYYASMNSLEDIQDSNLDIQVRGSPVLVPGRIGNALKFVTNQDYLEGYSYNASCLNNLTLCRYGFTISMWIMFKSVQQDTFILSTGNQAIRLYCNNGIFKGEIWERRNHRVASWEGVEIDRWYFLELSWSENDGIRLYVDLRQIIDEFWEIEDPPHSDDVMYVGRGSSGLQNLGSFIVDDLELWYGDRATLIQFNFIARDSPVEHSIAMDAILSNRTIHASLQVNVFGEPRIVRGQIDGALKLSGTNEYISIGIQSSTCLGNLDFCYNGILLSAWLKLGRLKEGMDILSTGNNGLQAYYSHGLFCIQARTSVHEWSLGSSSIAKDVWFFLEILWDPNQGLALMVDNELLVQNKTPVVRSDSYSIYEQFYIGHGTRNESNASNGNLTIDNFEYWFGNRDYLIAFDYLQRGMPQHYMIYMGLMQNGWIRHRDLNITVVGNPVVVPGKINNAIRLNGMNQYVNFGYQVLSCFGNPELCKHGVTGSILLNFQNFRANMSYLSSGAGVRLFYEGNKLVMLIHELRKQWIVETSVVVINKWYFIEYTWHRDKGLLLFINNQLIGEDKLGRTVSGYPDENHFLIGSSSSKYGQINFADVIVNEIEVWYGFREELVAFGYIFRDRVTHIVFSMENVFKNRILHPDYVVTMHNGVRQVPGKVGKGISLQGANEYVLFDDQRSSCLGNLEKCKHGLTIALFINPRQMINNSYLLSSGWYSIFIVDNILWARFHLRTKTWQLSTSQVTPNRWQKIEVSWDVWRGLQLYVNEALVNSTLIYREHSALNISGNAVYLGRPSFFGGGSSVDAVIDELEYWFANAKTFAYINESVSKFCIVDACQNGGLCLENITSFYCDCSLTSFVGDFCSEEAEGYQFGLDGGVAVFNITSLKSVSFYEIAFGFMTWSKKGILLRLSSSSSSRNIEISLDNSVVTIHYDAGNGDEQAVRIERKVNDGSSHRVIFMLNDTTLMLQVDNIQVLQKTLDDSLVLRNFDIAEVGARKNSSRSFINAFQGIIFGVAINGFQIMDPELIQGEETEKHVTLFGSTIIAKHPFYLPSQPIMPTMPDISPTKTADTDQGGAGIGWFPGEEGKEYVMFSDPFFQHQVGIGEVSRSDEGGRAAGISGAMLALLVLMSSLMWALYRFKPGIIGKVFLELESDPNISTPMISSETKSASHAGACDTKVLQVSHQSEHSKFLDPKMSERKPNIGQEMSLLAISLQSSGGHVIESDSGQNMATTAQDQKFLKVSTSSFKASEGITMQSKVKGNITTNLDQELLQVTTSSGKVSTKVSQGNVHNNSEVLMITTTGEVASRHQGTGLNTGGAMGRAAVVDTAVCNVSTEKATGGILEMTREVSTMQSNFAGIMERNQNSSAVNISDLRSTEYVVKSTDRSMGKNIVGQDLAHVTTSSHKSSADIAYNSSTERCLERNVLNQKTSQVTRFDELTLVQNMVVETNAGKDVGRTGVGQELSSVETSSQNISAEKIRDGKMAARTGEASRAMINTRGNIDKTQENLQVSINNQSPLESRIVGSGGWKATERMVLDQGLSHVTVSDQKRSKEMLSTEKTFGKSIIVSECTSAQLDSSSERSASSTQQQRPNTLAIKSSLEKSDVHLSVDDSKQILSLKSGDLKGNSLDHSSTSVKGKLPKTLKITSPVKPGGSGFAESGSLGVVPSLERTSSTVKGELPKTLKIEYTVKQGCSSVDSRSSSVTSPTLESIELPGSSFAQQMSTSFASKTTGEFIHANRMLQIMPLNIRQEEYYKNRVSVQGVSHVPLQSPSTRANNVIIDTSLVTEMIECILLTCDGQYLVTGSFNGPPQIWDMKTGESVRTMESYGLGTTDLHLANNDTLLIGLVANAEQIPNMTGSSSSIYKRLQIWDFESGQSLKMLKNESCTASFLMQDGEHVILGKMEVDIHGDSSLALVLWDILGNQPEQEIHCRLGKVPTDHVTYVNQSVDKRFVVAGFKNPRTGNATYVTVDLTVSNLDATKPTLTELAADVKVTAILKNHEAVTGTKAGGLVLWSLQTGRLQGQLMVAPPKDCQAHRLEVKDLFVSRDLQYLLSASADSTLCLWNMEEKTYIRTLTGHSDEVCCCSISNDNEFIISGSRDKTICLWRLENGNPITTIYTGADVFKVLMSNDKTTVTALADQDGDRKLIMLQVVSTKVKRRTESQEK